MVSAYSIVLEGVGQLCVLCRPISPYGVGLLYRPIVPYCVFLKSPIVVPSAVLCRLIVPYCVWPLVPYSVGLWPIVLGL